LAVRRYAALVADLLAHATSDRRDRGVDLTVRDPRFYKRALAAGDRARRILMDGWWDTPALDQAIARMLGADLRPREIVALCSLTRSPSTANCPMSGRPAAVPVALQDYEATAETHYEVGNDFYRMLLGRT